MLLRFVALLLGAFLCITFVCGCASSDETSSQPVELNSGQTTSHDATMLVAGTLQATLLDITGWDSGRANETSGRMLIETENGYYFAWCQVLYYADKSNLSLWIPVCSQPDCSHKKIDEFCDAAVLSELLLKDDRIFFNTTKQDTPALAEYGLYGEFIASMALDGSDKKLEYYISEVETVTNSQEQYSRSVLTSTYFVYSLCTLNQEGEYNTYVFAVDEDGVFTLASGTQDNNMLGSCLLRQSGIYGDEGFRANLIDGNYNMAYRLKNRELTAVDLEGLFQSGSHLSGDTLRIFRTGDGYYDIDLTTREETKLSDAQLENSLAHIMLPNCILESTLLGRDSTSLRDSVVNHEMKLFNGSVWLDVTLPDELIHASDTTILVPQAVTSDRIILVCRNTAVSVFDDAVQLYQILLTTDTPTLEYLGTIG